jgi:hypothetical protein
MMGEIVGRFKAGDACPSWLLDVEPVSPGAGRPAITFAIPCCIVETSSQYVVVADCRLPLKPNSDPGSPTGFYVNLGHPEGLCSLFAASKQVVLPMGFEIFGGETGGDDDGGDDPIPFVPNPLAGVV